MDDKLLPGTLEHANVSRFYEASMMWACMEEANTREIQFTKDLVQALTNKITVLEQELGAIVSNKETSEKQLNEAISEVALRLGITADPRTRFTISEQSGSLQIVPISSEE